MKTLMLGTATILTVLSSASFAQDVGVMGRCAMLHTMLGDHELYVNQNEDAADGYYADAIYYKAKATQNGVTEAQVDEIMAGEKPGIEPLIGKEATAADLAKMVAECKVAQSGGTAAVAPVQAPVVNAAPVDSSDPKSAR